MLIVVNFHYVRDAFDTPYPGIQGVTTCQFEQQLRLLQRSGEFVSLAETTAALNGGRLPGRALLVTFDDGLREQYDHALPILKRLGIPAVFFVNSAPRVEGRVMTVHKIHLLRSYIPPGDFEHWIRSRARDWEIPIGNKAPAKMVATQYPYDAPDIAALKYLLNFQLTLDDQRRLIEGCFAKLYPSPEPETLDRFYMDLAQIRSLAEHGSLGSHSHDHLPLGLLPLKAAAEQLQLSVAHLEGWTGQRPVALSYPYGMENSTSIQVQAAAESLGIRLAFTMERGRNDDLDQPLSLARFDCNDAPGGKACVWQPDEFFDQAPSARKFCCR